MSQCFVDFIHDRFVKKANGPTNAVDGVREDPVDLNLAVLKEPITFVGRYKWSPTANAGEHRSQRTNGHLARMRGGTVTKHHDARPRL